MSSPQAGDDVTAVIEPSIGEHIAGLQVLGINSLKTLSPPLEQLGGERVLDVELNERVVRLSTPRFLIDIDLQRTGRVVLVNSGERYGFGSAGTRPTVRLMIEGNRSFDFVEPAKTKRITVTITERPGAA